MGLFGNKSSENSFINQQKPEEKMETKRTKEEAQQELIEKFGLRKTSDFQLALQQGKIELAEEWLNYIVENKESFPQYASTWDSWLSDRQKDVELYKSLKDNGSLEKMEHRTKEEAQAELKEKFGFADTKGFRNALQNDVQAAEKWLNYIVENKMSFPQYLATWDNWLNDRQRELAEAKK
jgi:DNA mismatch repair ATPase MutS